jgi:hypothetical protein
MPSGNGKNVDSPLDQSRPQNESGGPSPQSASSNPQRSGLGRTLLLAGVFALLAMVFVPTPKYGYRLIFDRSDTSIAFFQLLVNVGFAALVGALVANVPWRRAWFRRVIYLVVACLAVVVVGVGIIALVRTWQASQQAAVVRARSDEQFADYLLRTVCDGVRGKDYLLHAAENWRIAGDTAKEQRARQRADNAYQEAAVARAAAAEQAAAEREAAALRKREAAAKAPPAFDPVFLYRQGMQTYVVQTGDTLFSISRKFYNSTERSNAIFDANRKNIRDPKKLTVGQTLIIP